MGSQGWKSTPDGGASPLFPPQHETGQAAQEAIEATIQQRPEHFGIPQTRWTLAAILTVCSWLRVKSLGGMCQVLKRLKIRRKRGRGHLHSPDPDYVGKLRRVWLLLRVVPCDPDKQVLLFSDELTFYRQPSLSYDYERAGTDRPLAELGHRSNLSWRVAGAINAWTGQLTYASHSRFTLKLLVDFYQQLANTYPNAEHIYLVVDNWPVHFHADVLAALRDPTIAWPLRLPGNWPETPSKKARYLDLPIQMLPLPTYAPWNNPIEKVWRLLKQQVLHLHRYQDDWDGLKARVHQELDKYCLPSPELLRYVGLQDPLRLYRALFQES
jgi:hypothetical protein